MKIAIIGSRGYPIVYGGYETFVKELSERLVDTGHEVTVYSHKNLFRKCPRMKNGIRIRYIYTIEKKNFSQFIHSFQSLIHSLFCRYDITLVLNPANGPFGILTRLFRKKTAIHVDGLEWKRPKWKGIGGKYLYYAAKLATRWFDRIVTDSEEMARIYLREFKCQPTVIAFGATILESSKKHLIKEWEIETREYYLVVGRLVPDNNGDLIIREFSRSRTNKKLVVVGDVPYSSRYAKSLKKTGDPRILFTGTISDAEKLSELYLNCYIYFHGHEFGGTNPSILKALACGCAVCALDTAFNQEVLKGREYGYYFIKQPGNLRDLIHEMEEKPEMVGELRKKSRNRIKKNYTWEKITGQYIDLFNQMVKPK